MADTPEAHSRTPESRRSRSRLLSRSPPRWAERRGQSERRTSEIVVERVVERVASERVAPVGNFLVLTKTNYYDWAALMCVMLQARGLWDAVIVGTMDYTEDRLALEVIAKAVPPELMGLIASKPSAKATWESLVLRNIGVDRVRKAKASTLSASSTRSRSRLVNRSTTSARASFGSPTSWRFSASSTRRRRL
jgi:hypothetical protein